MKKDVIRRGHAHASPFAIFLGTAALGITTKPRTSAKGGKRPAAAKRNAARKRRSDMPAFGHLRQQPPLSADRIARDEQSFADRVDAACKKNSAAPKPPSPGSFAARVAAAMSKVGR